MKIEESSSGDESGQKNNTPMATLEELHNLAGGTDIKVILSKLML